MSCKLLSDGHLRHDRSIFTNMYIVRLKTFKKVPVLIKNTFF